MIGKKLNLLLKELTTSQAKILLYKSTLSNDKRFQILKLLISIRQIDEDEINDFLQKQINLNWKILKLPILLQNLVQIIMATWNWLKG